LSPARCPEIDCIRGVLPSRVIAAAERRAQSIGVGGERVLICADAITEEAYLTALATSLDTIYQPLDRVSRADCPLDDNELIQAGAAGLLPLRHGREIIWIIAPRCFTARRLADPREPRQAWLKTFRLTSSEQLRRFVARHTHRALGRRAADGLRLARPLMSNAPRAQGWRSVVTVALMTFAGCYLALLPLETLESLSTILCLVFLAAAILRMATGLFTSRTPSQAFQIADDSLPIYTIICALYREAAVAGDLVAAIRALDYPPEKLDVKFVLEAEDHETRRALARLDLGAPFEIITAPPVGPRTKPKALNIALSFARGAYTAVYDAEDAPEPDQLRRAVAAFTSADERLACVQASLTIDNTADNWLARMFTADYAGQFDAFLPGLAALRLPFPLGGSSNHFRTAVLRKVGGWDPFNVTEDADLGIRLYRLGYRSAALSSVTYEEAPARFVPWLKQRTRWYKGWMQTWFVHMRRPGRLLRQLGPAGTAALQLFLAANVLAALIHPVFMAGLCYALLAAPNPWTVATASHAMPIFAATLLSGYVSTIVVDAIGLRRRGLLRQAWVLILTPAYWFLLSLAAWRALFQLLLAPQRWEKTEHGQAKTSRLKEERLSAANHRGARPVGHSPVAGIPPIAPVQIMATLHDPMRELARNRPVSRAMRDLR
jgi:cellulose synthase/poly-beta-1,6-N-acetylglucosamine synthase-like glycosyltransferase